jgi:hypothetical protein
MKNERILRTVVPVVVVVMILAAAAPANAKDKFRETYTAQAIAMGTSNPPILPPGTNTRVDINITRWTTDEEREALFKVLVEEGQEGLIKALRKQKETGFLRIHSRGRGGMSSPMPTEQFRYAREFKNDDGSRRIVLAFDRPISMYEATRQPRSSKYDMTLLVMDVDANGLGEGQLAIAVQIEVDTDSKKLLIENYGTEPVRLRNISRTD